MQFSVIIPTYNEAAHIGKLIKQLLDNSNPADVEVLVVDAGSTDGTAEIVSGTRATLIRATKKGRSAQMNQGAQQASGRILYFVHGDTLPPESYRSDIEEAISMGYQMGCYRFRFDSDKRALRFNNYMTRFNVLFSRGGDQSMFISRNDFFALGAFREDYIIMEDFEFLVRAKRNRFSFRIIPKDILVSARKYDNNSYLRVMSANALVFCMYFLGASQETLCKTYKGLLH
ncbi:MAG: TIGR04283 family arsenosugar biosynthesis glycosyltransferase [Saprospiraceae bacterium]|nr:TIGR04283 family arsenosugar biosynthesis glycosyltransferase [Saprospiraceae bacterium]